MGGAGSAELSPALAGEGAVAPAALSPPGWPAVEAPAVPLRTFAGAGWAGAPAVAVRDGGGGEGAAAAARRGAVQLRVRERAIADDYDVSLVGTADAAGRSEVKDETLWSLRSVGAPLVRELRVADAASGAAVAHVWRQPISLAPVYRLRAAGGDSDAAVVRKRLLRLRPTYDIFVRRPDEQDDDEGQRDLLHTRPVVTASGSAMELAYTFHDRERGHSSVLGGYGNGARVAVARHELGSILSSRDEYVLTIAPDVDLLLMACALVAIDDNESRERHRR